MIDEEVSAFFLIKTDLNSHPTCVDHVSIRSRIILVCSSAPNLAWSAGKNCISLAILWIVKRLGLEIKSEQTRKKLGKKSLPPSRSANLLTRPLPWSWNSLSSESMTVAYQCWTAFDVPLQIGGGKWECTFLFLRLFRWFVNSAGSIRAKKKSTNWEKNLTKSCCVESW